MTMATNMGCTLRPAYAFADAPIVSTLSTKSLRRKAQVSRVFAQPKIVATLSRQLNRISVDRSLRAIMDVDLSELYGARTKRLNAQRKRHRSHFPSNFLFQLTVDVKAEVVANCDYLQNLTNPSAPGKRTIGFLTHEDKKPPKASRLTKVRKAP